jgi:transposase
LGRSKGGFTSKIHAKVDAFGLPLEYRITGGERNDITQAQSLLGAGNCDWMIADRGYDCDAFRKTLKECGIEPVIPGRKNRKTPITYDEHIYKERNVVERFFNRIKGFRRVATRYDKTAKMFLGSLYVVGIFLWLLI